MLKMEASIYIIIVFSFGAIDVTSENGVVNTQWTKRIQIGHIFSVKGVKDFLKGHPLVVRDKSNAQLTIWCDKNEFFV